MRRKLVLTLSVAIAIGAIAAIAFVGGRWASDSSVAPLAAIGDGGAGGLAAPIAAVGADGPIGSESEITSSKSDQAGVPNDGIQVHGRWTIEVTEPDGRFVSLTEFDNELTNGGEETLAKLLAHDTGIGRWQVTLEGASLGTQPCRSGTTPGAGPPFRCQIFQAPSTEPGIVANGARFGDLSVDLVNPTSGEYQVVLSGSVTTGNDTDIIRVSARVQQCSTSSAPADWLTCVTLPQVESGYTTFTSTPLTEVIPVLPNQTVNVTVVISFS